MSQQALPRGAQLPGVVRDLPVVTKAPKTEVQDSCPVPRPLSCRASSFVKRELLKTPEGCPIAALTKRSAGIIALFLVEREDSLFTNSPEDLCASRLTGR